MLSRFQVNSNGISSRFFKVCNVYLLMKRSFLTSQGMDFPLFLQQIFPVAPFLKEAIEVPLSQPDPFRIRQSSILLNWITGQRQVWRYNYFCAAIPHGEVKINIHIVGEAVTFVEETHLLEQLSAKSHTEPVDYLNLRAFALLKMAQIVGMQTM